MLLTIGSFIVVLGVLIFVHEAGHFVAAKAVGVQVLRFSLGFGRPILSWRRGETEYWISWIPFGGYVKMAGTEEEGLAGELEGGKSAVAVDPARAFDKKPLWARFIVVVAGVTMNAVFAFAVYTGLAFTGSLEPDNIATTQVDSVMADELPPQVQALGSLRRGDRITTVNDDSVRTWGDLRVKLVSAPSPVRIGIAGRPEPLVIPVSETDTSGRLAMVLVLSPYLPPVISTVQAGGAGAKAGLEPGDRILKVDEDTVRSWQDFARVARRNPERSITVAVQRGAERLSLTVVPDRREERDPGRKEARVYGFVGVGAVYPALARPGPLGAVRLGWEETTDRAALVLDFLRKFVTGQASPRELGGPLLIGQISGQAARVGLGFFLSFMAFLSVNLAILNLLPIPVLDGGQVVFLLAEAVRRKPLPMELRLRLTQIGIVVIIGIMIFATSNDILRWLGNVFER
jgi:regulator of sigma E protease